MTLEYMDKYFELNICGFISIIKCVTSNYLTIHVIYLIRYVIINLKGLQ